eukprot:8236231-Prorocentrum_lima.AAC.1
MARSAASSLSRRPRCRLPPGLPPGDRFEELGGAGLGILLQAAAASTSFDGMRKKESECFSQ